MKNKRRGPDFIIKTIGWFSIISWVILISIVGILMVTNPALRGVVLVNMPARQISQGWLLLINILLVFLIIINIFGIIFNFVRLKRKTDSIRITFFFSSILAIIGLIIISIKWELSYPFYSCSKKWLFSFQMLKYKSSNVRDSRCNISDVKSLITYYIRSFQITIYLIRPEKIKIRQWNIPQNHE